MKTLEQHLLYIYNTSRTLLTMNVSVGILKESYISKTL